MNREDMGVDVLVLHQKIVQLRKSKKITQEELSRKIGVTRSALSQYELGLRQPDYDIVKRMADYFNVSTDYLLGRETKKPIRSDLELSDDELIQKYNVVLDGKPIPEDILREILSYVRVRRSQKQ